MIVHDKRLRRIVFSNGSNNAVSLVKMDDVEVFSIRKNVRERRCVFAIGEVSEEVVSP